MAQNSEDNLEEREQKLSEMEVRAALAFQQQQSAITTRAESLDKRERELRDRAKELDAQIEAQENSLIMREEQIKAQEKAVRDNAQKLAEDRAEFEAQKQDLAASASGKPHQTPPDNTKVRSHDDQERIRALEDALVEQENLFKVQLDSSLSNQRSEFEVQLRQSLAQQESNFTSQLRAVEKAAGMSSQEVAKLRQELSDKSDEYEASYKREAALQAEILRMREREVGLAKEPVILVEQVEKGPEILKTPVVPVFGEKSDLWKYLESANSKDLAASLDRNMVHHNITIPKDLIIDDSMKKSFSPQVLAKMEEVGRELEKRIEKRSTFAGKFRQKTRDYSAIVIHAFKKLFGKKVDDPNLKKACDEYNKNSPHLEGEQAKKVGKFVAHVLSSKGGKVEDLANNSR